MTYCEKEVVPELKVRCGADDNNGNYLKLSRNREESELENEEGFCELPEPSSPGRTGWSFCYWVKFVVLLILLGSMAVVFIKWIGPFFMDKEIIPIISWETKTFSPPILAVIVFITMALFPSLLIPSSPSMWVAGMTFGYGFGFLLIISGAAIGVSLPFFIGSLFCHKIQGFIEKYPKRAIILKSAGEGNWFHQFQAVTLIRISPFPYIVYNYCAVATNVKYGPYLLGSLVGMVPEVFVSIYTGILIRTLADASHPGHFISAPQIIVTSVGFSISVATTVFFTRYARRQLKKFRKEDEQLLQ